MRGEGYWAWMIFYPEYRLVEYSASRGMQFKAHHYRQSAGDYYVMPEPLDYEPTADRQIRSLAAAAGQTIEAYFYDLLIGDGAGMAIHFLTNYSYGNLDVTREFLMHPTTVTGLGDAGAHMRVVCDGAASSFHLAFWSRDRTRGPGIPLETMVRKLTSECADLYDMTDRGRIRVGQKADINVIDHSRLSLGMPRTQYDLPLGGPRLIQKATGYLATLVNGEVTRRFDEATGARPGRLVRPRSPSMERRAA